jgi:hypothetical protein
LTEPPGPPDANGIRTAGDASFITYANQHYPVQYDNAFRTWRIRPPVGSDHGYWIPVEYDRHAKAWSARLLAPTAEMSAPFDSGKARWIGYRRHMDTESCGVNRAVTERSMPELIAVLRALHTGTSSQVFPSTDSNLALDASPAFNALSDAQKSALRRFIVSEPLLTRSPPTGRDIPLMPLAERWDPKQRAIEALRHYSDLLGALRRLPAGPIDGKPLIVAGEPGLLRAFAAGDIVTNGELPLASTTHGKRVMHVLTEQVASKRRSGQDRQLVFIVHGHSARVVGDPQAAGTRHRVFLPNTRFRVESISRGDGDREPLSGQGHQRDRAGGSA